MPHTLIIGYGNPLREDDGVGPRAVELLVAAGLADGVEALMCHLLTIELAPRIAETERLILIDARADGEPGAVQEDTLTPQAVPGSSLTHHVDAAGLLAAAQILYGNAPATTLFTVSGAAFGYSEALSPIVEAALPGLVARLLSAVSE